MANTPGHFITDVSVKMPSKALAQIMLGPGMGAFLQVLGEEVVLRYQAKVAKDSGDLMRSAKATVPIGGHLNDRLIAKVTVGGDLAVGYWKSRRNPNPGDKFYYGVLHEHGDGGHPPSGRDFPAAHDLKAVMETM